MSVKMKKTLFPMLLLILAVLFLYSMTLGNYKIPLTNIFSILSRIFIPDTNNLSDQYSEQEKLVLLDLRLPRILMVIIVGAGLGITGGASQALFRNPLVSPFILGISAGAALGASIAIIYFGSDPYMIELFAFFGGLFAVGCAYFIAYNRSGHVSMIKLVLAGVVISAFLHSMTGILKYLADPESQLPTITFWLMGGFDAISWENLFPNSIFIIGGSVILSLSGFQLNLLSLGDFESKSLGVRVEFLKIFIIITITLIVGSAVAECGIIGWIGLVVPHITRMIFGPDHRILLPVSAIIGAIFLLIADNIARTITSGEIPIGIITSLIGAPFFAYLLRKKSAELWN